MELRPLLPPSAQLRSGTEPTTLPVRRFSIPVCHEHHPDAPSEIPITRTNDLASHADRVTRISLRPS